MTEHREHDELRRQLESYHEPPAYPQESIEAGVMARVSGTTPPGRSGLRVRPPAAAAAAIALFAAGVLAGRNWARSPSTDSQGTAVHVQDVTRTEPVPSDYTVVWF